MRTDHKVAVFLLDSLVARVACIAVLSFSSAVTQAQLNNLPDFFAKHFQIEASDAQDGPKLYTQLDYIPDENVIARSLVKMNNDGFEDHMEVGLVQNFDTASAKLTYNLHRFNYSDRDDQTDEVIFDFHYQSLSVRHRYQETEQVTIIGIPFDLFAAQIDLSYSQIFQQGSDDSIDVYSFASQVSGLKLSATWKESGDNSSADFSAEYRPSGNWLMKFVYCDTSEELLKQFRGEYAADGYRLAGEYKSQIDDWDQTRISSSIGIEKDTRLAELHLGLEYDDAIESPSIIFKIKSEFVF